VIGLKKLGIFILTLFLLSSIALAAETDCIYFFQGVDCVDCAKADKFIDQLQANMPQLKVEKFEVYQNLDNSKLLNQYFDLYSIPKESRGIPAVFTSNTYLIGSTSIIDFLEGKIKDTKGSDCPSLEEAGFIGVVGEEKETHDVLKTLNFAGVTGSALEDSFSVGLIAVLLLMLALIVAIKDEVEMVKRAAMFIGASFLAYLLVGYGWLTLFSHSAIYLFFYKIIGVIAIIVGIVRVKGFFGTWKVLKENFPEKFTKNLQEIKKVLISPWGVTIIGFLAALLTSGRLNKIFGTLQSLMSESGFRMAAFPLILYYIILLLIPLTVAVVILRFVREIQIDNLEEKEDNLSDSKKAAWKKHNLKIFKFSVGLIMVVAGLILLFV